jgi:hypothetical protein
MTQSELEDRLDDITSMGSRRAKIHFKALILDLIGDVPEGHISVEGCCRECDQVNMVRELIGNG